MIFRFSLDRLPAADVVYLRGYLAFVRSIEPVVISRLERKYGSEVLTQIMSENLVSRKKFGIAAVD